LAEIDERGSDRMQVRLPKYVYERLGGEGAIDMNQLFDFFNNLEFERGKNLRDFHDAGFARHAGHTGNYQIDELNGAHVLLDLDSSIRKKDIDSRSVFLTQTLDVMSALRGIHEFECISAMCIIQDSHDYPMNPYLHFLRGYFNNIRKNKKIERVAEVLFDKFTRPFMGSTRDKYFEARNSFVMVSIPPIYGLMTESLRDEGVSPPYNRGRLKKELKEYAEAFRAVGELPNIDASLNEELLKSLRV